MLGLLKSIFFGWGGEVDTFNLEYFLYFNIIYLFEFNDDSGMS